MRHTWIFVVLLAMLMIPALALADGPVLLVELPEEAQMTENVEFEDGDFIQSYQLGSAQIQLLRYADFDMTLDELVSSDWAENCGTEPLELTEVSGYPAQGVRVYQAVDASGYPVGASREALSEGQQLMEVRLVLVRVGDCALIYQDMRMSGAEGELPPIETLKVQGGEREQEVG